MDDSHHRYDLRFGSIQSPGRKPRERLGAATTMMPSDFLRDEPQPIGHILWQYTDALILIEALLPIDTRTWTYDR